MANEERRAAPTLPADCAMMIAQYPPPDATGNPPANLPSNLRSRYSTCMMLWRAFNVRAGRDPLDGGTGTGTTSTTSTTTTSTSTGTSTTGTRTPRKKFVGSRKVTPGLMPRKKFQPSGGKKKQAVSKTVPEVASAGTNWKLIGLGVAVLALVGGGYWWSQRDDEDDEE